MNLKPYITTTENAEKIAEWLRTRGGIAIWQSIDFSRSGQTMTTPVNTAEGSPAPKPVDWVANKPALIITDPADVIISKDVEVKRFHVAVRAGANGMTIKSTDGATRRIERAVIKAGEGAYHVLDYATREAVILKPESQMPLLEYLANQNIPVTTPTETQQQETFCQPIKRLSTEGDPSAPDLFVKGSTLCPVTILSPLPPEKSEHSPMRSDDEIFNDLAKILQEGERDGSIHFNPPSENYLKDMLPSETDKDGEPSTATTAPKQPEEESQVAPPSREQLRCLLNDFLEQLAASKLPAGEAPEGVLVVDPTMWASLTKEDQGKYLHELSLTKRTYIVNGVKYIYDDDIGPVSWTSGGSSEKPKNPS